MIDRNDWYAPWFDRTTWIFEHLEEFDLRPEEIVTLLVINYLQTSGKPLTEDMLSLKTGLDSDTVDRMFTTLCEKGCLDIDTRNKSVEFHLECMLENGTAVPQALSKSLLEEVSSEFGRPLSASEYERLTAMGDLYDEATILHALDEAAAYNKRSLAYMEALLSSWKAKGLSAADIESGRR